MDGYLVRLARSSENSRIWELWWFREEYPEEASDRIWGESKGECLRSLAAMFYDMEQAEKKAGTETP